jgi:hypothetical protein
MQNIIKTFSNGVHGFIETQHITEFTSSSEESQFIPVNSLIDGELINFKNRRTFIYSLALPIPNIRDFRKAKKFSTFCKVILGERDIGSWSSIEHRSLIKTYICCHGIILCVEEFPVKIFPLMVMSVKKDYLFSFSKDNPEPNKLCLVIDNSFINNPEHFKLYRNVKKYYIDDMEEKIDSHYTHNIMDSCYKAEITLPKFKTIPDMIKHTNSINEVLTKSIITT